MVVAGATFQPLHEKSDGIGNKMCDAVAAYGSLD